MTKNDFELAQSLSVIIDARKHVDKYRSIANDSGTNERTSMHFLERVLNSKSAELAPTQAAAIALGFKSSMHTQSYINMYVWDSERLVRILAAGGSTLADEEGPEAGDDAEPATGDEATSADAVLAGACGVDDDDDATNESPPQQRIDEEVDDLLDDDSEMLKLSKGRHGKCNVYTLKSQDGTVTKVAISQAEHYAWRSLRLRYLSFDEFVMSMQLVRIKDLTKKQHEDYEQGKLNEAHAGGGRARSYFWDLRPPHKLAGIYLLKRRAKFEVPILIGDPPPQLPPLGRRETAQRAAARCKHAAYFTANFRPWHGAERSSQWAVGTGQLTTAPTYMVVDSECVKEDKCDVPDHELEAWDFDELDSSPDGDQGWDAFIEGLEAVAFPTFTDEDLPSTLADGAASPTQAHGGRRLRVTSGRTNELN